MFQTEKALIILPTKLNEIHGADDLTEEEKIEIYKAILHDTSNYYAEKSRNTKVYVYFPDYETCDILVPVFPLRVKVSIIEKESGVYIESIDRAFKEDCKLVTLVKITSLFYPLPWINNAYEVLTHKYDVIVTSIYKDNPNRLVGLKKLHEKFLSMVENENDELDILKSASQLDVLFVPLRRIEYTTDLKSLKQIYLNIVSSSKNEEFKRTKLVILNILKKRKIPLLD
jgi:hypothetical protein